MILTSSDLRFSSPRRRDRASPESTRVQSDPETASCVLVRCSKHAFYLKLYLNAIHYTKHKKADHNVVTVVTLGAYL